MCGLSPGLPFLGEQVMDSIQEKLCGDSECLIKEPQSLAGNFSPNTRRRDGFNLYCRVCCCRRVTAGRVKQRARKAERKRLDEERMAREFPPLLPAQREKRAKPDRDTRVWIAILHKHARTQRDIKREAHVASKDELGLSLAELMLNREWVKSDVLPDGERVYFPNLALKKKRANNHDHKSHSSQRSGSSYL